MVDVYIVGNIDFNFFYKIYVFFFFVMLCLYDMLWYCCYFLYREEEKLMIWDKIKIIVSECKIILDRIKILYIFYVVKLLENVVKVVYNG